MMMRARLGAALASCLTLLVFGGTPGLEVRKLAGLNVVNPAFPVTELPGPGELVNTTGDILVGTFSSIMGWEVMDTDISPNTYHGWAFPILGQVATLAWTNGLVFEAPATMAPQTLEVLFMDQCEEPVLKQAGKKCQTPYTVGMAMDFFVGREDNGIPGYELQRCQAVVGGTQFTDEAAHFAHMHGTPMIGYYEEADLLSDRATFPHFVRTNAPKLRKFEVASAVLRALDFTRLDHLVCNVDGSQLMIATSNELMSGRGLFPSAFVLRKNPLTGLMPGSAEEVAYLLAMDANNTDVASRKKEQWDTLIKGQLDYNAHAHLESLSEECAHFDLMHYLSMHELVGQGHFWLGNNPGFEAYEGIYLPFINGALRDASPYAAYRPYDGGLFFDVTIDGAEERTQYKTFETLLALVGDNQDQYLPAWLRNRLPAQAFQNLKSPLWAGSAGLDFAQSLIVALSAINSLLVSKGPGFTGPELLQEIYSTDLEGITRRFRFNDGGDGILDVNFINYVYPADWAGHTPTSTPATQKIVGYYDTNITWTKAMTFYAGRTTPPTDLDFPCPKGEMYVREHGKCIKCQPGQFTSNVGMAYCEVCQTGEYSDVEAATVCTPCGMGQFQSSPGSTQCEDCVAGTYNDGIQQSVCKSCQAGSYSGDNAMKCILCDVGFFADAKASTSCRQCSGAFTTRSIGSDKIEDCICSEGTYRAASTRDSCTPCPGGMTCERGSDELHFGFYTTGTAVSGCKSEKECIVPQADELYMTKLEEPMVPYKCLNEEMCPGGKPGTCGGGFDPTKVACGLCPEGKRKSGSTCEDCQRPPDVLPVALLVPVIICILSVIIYFVNRDKMMETKVSLSFGLLATITISTAQTMAMFATLSVEWFEPLSGGVSFMGFLQFDPELLRPGCSLTSDPTTMFIGRQLVPLALCLLIVIILMVQKFLVRMKVDLFVNFTNTIGTIFYGLFISMISSSFMPFVCYPHPDNTWSMLSEPSVKCWESDVHVFMMSVAVLLFICVPVPFLAVVIWATKNHARFCREGAAGFNRNLLAFRFLFHRFEFHAYYYSCINIVRGLLVCLTPVVIAKDPVFQLTVLASIILGIGLISNKLQPWRAAVANYTEAAMNSLLVLLIVCGAANADLTAFSGSVQVFAIFIIVSSGTCVALILLKASYRFFRPPVTYDVSICCHSGDAGSQARLLKLLMGQQGLTVLLDSDCHNDADLMFDLMKKSVKNLAVFLTRNCLPSALCAGEIAIAHRAKLQMVGLRAPSFVPPLPEDLNNLPGYLDVSNVSLGQLAIDWNMVRVAFEALLNNSKIMDLAGFPSDWRVRFNEVMKIFTPKPPVVPEVDAPRPSMLVYSADASDDDAVAAAGIVACKMVQIRPDAGTYDDFFMLFDYMPSDSTNIVLESARAVIVVLSKGSLQSKMQLQVIRLAMARYVHVHGTINDMLGARSFARKESRKSFKVDRNSGGGPSRSSDRSRSSGASGLLARSTSRGSRGMRTSIKTAPFEVIAVHITGFHFPMSSAYEVLFPGLSQDDILNVQTFFNRLTGKVSTEAPDNVLDLQIKTVALWVPSGKAQGATLDTKSSASLGTASCETDIDVEVWRADHLGANTKTVYI